MDFTIIKYKELLTSLMNRQYVFQSFGEYLKDPRKKSMVLRHDVDKRPENSLLFARIQRDNGIKGVYYFRAVSQSWDETIIKEIHSLGHEVGYHYECLTTCNGDIEKAIKDFEKNLSRLRTLVPVSTICMHGSPMSKYDSKDLWKHYDYKDFGIIGEPYFDIDFNRVLYLTDTGRRWNGQKVSVRDKVSSAFNFSFRSTEDIIDAAKNQQLPDKIMFTFHPQRWNDGILDWTKELVMQHIKNIVKKKFFVSSQKGGHISA